MNDPLALPFDQYQRYRLVADLLTKLRAGGAPLTVLDVGGRTAVLRDFLPKERITLVDMEASDQNGLVLGDGSALPFADDAFDVVAAFDTLEHVPPARRKAFVAECARVSRRWVVLCGPYQHERVAQAELLLQRFLKDKLGEEHRYLEEHRHNGLPERESTEAQLRSLGARVESIGHANLDRWLVLQCLSMYMDYDPALRPLAHEFQRFYNRSLYASDHAEPVYRHALIAAFDGAPIPTAADLLGPPRAPAGTLAPFQDLAGELVAFDRDREAWRAERNALLKANDDLRHDLDGHRKSVENLRREVDEQRAELSREHDRARASIAELEHDLAGHRETLADLRSELDGARKHAATVAQDRDGQLATRAERERHAAELELSVRDLRADLESHRAALAAVNADLAGHRAALADVGADLAGHKAALTHAQAELEAREGALAAARAEIAAQHSRADVLDEELRESLALASGLEKSLADREMVYDQLKAELSSRWRNFLRVFRPHR